MHVSTERDRIRETLLDILKFFPEDDPCFLFAEKCNADTVSRKMLTDNGIRVPIWACVGCNAPRKTLVFLEPDVGICFRCAEKAAKLLEGK